MLIVTFSGLDGCGKSTHVERTLEFLSSRGIRARSVMTVRISVTGFTLILRQWLQSIGSSALDQKTAVAPSGARIRVYDRNRTFVEDRERSVAILKRWIAYPLDAIALRLFMAWQKLHGVEAVVCDRYIYDKLVNLPDSLGPLSSIVRWLAPNADLAFFLDVPPEEAKSRREEHDTSYYEAKYASYQEIVNARWSLERLEVSTIDAMQQLIEERLQQVVPEGIVIKGEQ